MRFSGRDEYSCSSTGSVMPCLLRNCRWCGSWRGLNGPNSMLARHDGTPSFAEGTRAQKVGPLQTLVCESLLCFMAFSTHRDVSSELQFRLTGMLGCYFL